MSKRGVRRAVKGSVPRILRNVRVGVLGTGQTGGSLVQCLGRYSPVIELAAFDRAAAIRAAVSRHARWCGSLRELVRGSDVLLLAIPAHEIVRVLPQVARLSRRRESTRKLIVCDVATIKAPTVSAAARYQDAFDFIGLHPLAGVERNGWSAADPDMFVGRTVVYCPGPPALNQMARGIVRLMGGRPVAMDADFHDRLIAMSIGLPHVVAFAAASLAGSGADAASLRGGSWSSLTRVAVSSPAMVAGFLQGNARYQLSVLRLLQKRLGAVEAALRQGSEAKLERQLRRWQEAGRAGSRRR